jgi:hypothetical protein
MYVYFLLYTHPFTHTPTPKTHTPKTHTYTHIPKTHIHTHTTKPKTHMYIIMTVIHAISEYIHVTYIMLNCDKSQQTRHIIPSDHTSSLHLKLVSWKFKTFINHTNFHIPQAYYGETMYISRMV